MNNINQYLNKRAQELMVYKMPRNEDLMNEIFSFDPKNLESTSSADISRYAIGLAQFLIFFCSQINASKVKLMQKRRVLDTYVNQSNIKAKTKAEKRRKVIDSNNELKKIEVDIEALESEIQMTDGLEKYYLELINSFKRELTRREQEFKLNRSERRL